ncbi:MAG: fatty acid desaturase, partial [Pirellulaceae bacterium]|nr:fatty acid desaturase [Pirellulaceae bacterium]
MTLQATLLSPPEGADSRSEDFQQVERFHSPPEPAASDDRRTALKDFDPMLAPYRESSAARSIWQLASTFSLFALLNVVIYASLSYSYWPVAVLIPFAALLTVRLFIFQHDCGHRSFFKSKKWNDRIGFALGILTLTPYEFWRRTHASHHATSGDLDRRGKSGEIYTMTVKEYQNASWIKRLFYRIYRNPLVLFGVGPFFQFAIRQRFAFELPKAWKKERRSVYWTNLGILLLAALMCWLVGPLNFLIVQLCISAMASSIGVWMFYMQHQYEDAFWEHSHDWDYVQAALDGSSYYRLPKVWQWFTGNIGLHHVHHLDSR